MKGKHKFIVQSKRMLFEFEIKRNITILQGDSATGKTTLLNLLSSYLFERDLNIKVTTDVNFEVFIRDYANIGWKTVFDLYKDSVIFIEENNDFIFTKEFASYVKASNNYFVFVTRKSIYTLPYSYKEIYKISYEKKKNKPQNVYKFTEIYSNFPTILNTVDNILVEDSHSGFKFFSKLFFNIGVLTANGNSNLFNELKNIAMKKCLLIADGAAFGAYIAEIIDYITDNLDKRVILYLPESFEWLLLKSKVIAFKDLDQILENPSDYIESSVYVSWERFFTDLAINYSDENHKYSKHKLDSYYLDQNTLDKVKSILPKELQEIIDRNNTNEGNNSNLSQMNLF